MKRSRATITIDGGEPIELEGFEVTPASTNSSAAAFDPLCCEHVVAVRATTDSLWDDLNLLAAEVPPWVM